MNIFFAILISIPGLILGKNPPQEESAQIREAYLGGGCFWCLEAIYERVPGVLDVTNGYAGGRTPNPTYSQVCSNKTGHAEVVRIQFDRRQITYSQLLDLFWKSHDPTTVDRQGADIGSQYRSIILYTSEEQKQAAQRSIREINASGAYDQPVVTTVEPLERFYPAEDYHQNYFRNHPNAPYCVFVIQPKLDKVK